MTVVLAAKAMDGVVMCADGASTLTTPLGEPIAVQAEEKIYACGGRFIWGASGDLGVIQRVKHKLDHSHLHDLRPKDPEALRAKIVPVVLSVMKECRQDHLGPVAAGVRETVPCATVLFAGYLPTGPCVIMVDPDGKNSVVSGPHVAIGSGAQAAMAIMHRHRGEARSCALTELVCYRAITDAIEVTPMFLAEPITLGTARKDDASISADSEVMVLVSSQLNAVRDSVEVWKQNEREALEKSLGALKNAGVAADEGEQPPAVP